jgi:hypothetical protein
MSRTLTAGVLAEITGESLNPVLLVKAEFSSGDFNLWSGIGDLSFNGDTYSGVGDLLGVSRTEETMETRATTLNISLSGIPSTTLSLVLSEDFQGKPATLWFGILDSSGALISNPVIVFKGKMDVMDISEDGDSSTVSVSAESDLVELKDSRERRYTDEDQQELYPGDRGLEFVVAIQDRTLVWGPIEADRANQPPIPPPRMQGGSLIDFEGRGG